MAERVRAGLSPAEGRRFAFPVGAAFAVLGAVTGWRGHEVLAAGFAAVAGALLLAGALIPGRLGPVYRAWMAFARGLSRVTTPVFLAIVYFVIIMPIGLLMRLVGRNPIRHRASHGSYWTVRGDRRGDMTNQF